MGVGAVAVETESWTPPLGGFFGRIPLATGYSNGCRACRSENVRDCLRRSKLELRGPRNGLNIGP
eukprot:13826235-Alexandrium_andersonii.AAC.1